MKKYLKVYRTLLILNFATLNAYRGAFINSSLNTIIWGSFSIIIIFLLTSKASSIYGWTANELYILAGLYNIVIGFFHMLFSRNFERFSRVINLGQLDTILIKPLDSQFLLSFWFINYTSLIRIFLGIGTIVYILTIFDKPFNFLSLFLFIPLCILSLIMLYSIWFIICTLLIWFTNLSNLIDLLYEVNSVARFPQEMYRGFGQTVLLFLFPLTILLTTPAKSLLSRLTFFDVLITLILSLSLLVVSRAFWKFALRFYTSASS